MTGDELLTYTRTDMLRDAATPYLWSDDLIMLYLNEAERAFCRHTHALLDNDSQFTAIDLTAGEHTYTLDPRIIYVYSAILSTGSADLLNFTRKFIPNHLLTATGTPSMFVMDEARLKLRVYPVPDVDAVLNLRVARLPLADMTEATSPEIPAQYHLDLAEYAVYRCLRNNDVDGKSEMDAELFKKNWSQRLSVAKNEYYQMRSGNNPTSRGNWTGKVRY